MGGALDAGVQVPGGHSNPWESGRQLLGGALRAAARPSGTEWTDAGGQVVTVGSRWPRTPSVRMGMGGDQKWGDPKGPMQRNLCKSAV